MIVQIFTRDNIATMIIVIAIVVWLRHEAKVLMQEEKNNNDFS
jgi:hypothetical protein